MTSVLESLVLDSLDLNASAGTAANTNPYRDAVIADSPVAYYRLAESSGTTATDIGSGAHNGTYVNAPTLGVTSPISDTGDTAVTFNAASSQRVTAALVSTATNNYAIECWVQLSSLTAQKARIVLNGTVNSGWCMMISNGLGSGTGLVLTGVLGGVAGFNSGYTFADTNWHHIVMTREAGTTKFYVDGSLQAGTSASAPIAPLTGTFIASDDTGADLFTGSVDEVAIYNTALTSTQVTAHYAARTGATGGIASGLRLQGFEAPPPAKRAEWAQGADTDGSLLVRDPLFENRTITLRLRVSQQTSMDAALAQIGTLAKKLEECENNPDGLALVWTPANSTKSFTFYVLSGTIDGVPVNQTGDDAGWFLRAPVVNVTLTCKPFGYGAPVTSSTASSATPFVTLTLASVAGDVPAEGRLLVTDAATQNRRYIEWGLEQRYYDAATSLLVDSDDMTVTGFSGTQTTHTGAYDPNATGNSIIFATMYGSPTAVCGTGNLSHVGTFRVKARIFGSASDVRLRLGWQEGDGPFAANPWVTPTVAGHFSEVDLGLVTIPPKQLGTQRWTGRIEAYTTATPGTDTLEIDYLVLVPAGEGYGRVRAADVATASLFGASDDFTGITPGAALNARAGLNGTWATSGSTTDLAGTASGITGDGVARSTTSDTGPRFAVLGTALTATDVAAAAQYSVQRVGMKVGLLARWVDASNYLAAYIYFVLRSPTTFVGIQVDKIVAGVTTTLDSLTIGSGGTAGTPHDLRLRVYADGSWSFTALGQELNGQDSALATAGTLASGKPGLIDANTSSGASTRTYDSVAVLIPPSPPIALYSGRTAEIRSDGAIRQDSTGTYYGNVPAYRGSRFLVPPAGDANRSSRILVKAHRNDIEAAASENVTDNLTVQVVHTPRFLAVPY